MPRYVLLLLAVVVGAGLASAQQPPDPTSYYQVGFAAGIEAARARDSQDVPRDGKAPLRKGRSHLAGRVTGTNGVPVRLATLRLSAPELGGTATSTSDREGRYEFRDLPAGRYTISASKDGFVPMMLGQRRPDAQPTAIDVGEGQLIEAPDVALPRGGAITGRILDEFGEPMPDAQVIPLQRRLLGGRLRLVNASARAAVTNDVGEFRIYGLKPGTYWVVTTGRKLAASDDDVDAWGYGDLYYPGTGDSSDAQPIVVGLGDTIAGIDFTVMPARLAKVSGSAVNASGEPLRFGVVTVASSNSYRLTPSNMTASILPDGTFTVKGLAPGSYLLRMPFALDVAQSLLPVARSERSPDRLAEVEFLTATVDVAGIDLGGVLLAPRRMLTMSGRVKVDSATAASVASAEASVTASTLDADPFSLTTRVRADGSFQLAIPAGLVMIKAGFVNPEWAVKAVRVAGIDVTDTGVDLRNVDATVAVEIEITRRPPQVGGAVVGAGGRVVPRATVLIFPEERKQWLFGTRLMPMIPADAQGRYTLNTLPPGRYLAAAFEYAEPLVRDDPDFLESLRTRATAFSLADGEQKTLNLPLIR